MKKALCVCQGGRVRSVALRYLLTDQLGYDALACGLEKQSPETLEMLYAWADVIYLLDTRFVDSVPEKWRGKLVVLDVGPDVWDNAKHPVLLDLLRGLLRSKL